MSKNSLRFGFEIVMERGSVPRPVAVRFPKAAAKEHPKPFKYMADALCGLSLLKVRPELVKSFGLSPEFCADAWTALEPHWEIWQRSRDRVQAIHVESSKADRRRGGEFEKFCDDVIKESFSADGIDLRGLWKLIDPINKLEDRKNSALIYNFGLSFSEEFCQRLCALHSFLFNLRSLVAVDWNAHVEDASHEAVRVDSITDYLPKAEYIVNDAMLYWHFKNLSKTFTEGRQSDVRVEKMLVEPMMKNFRRTSHNACHLIDHLPERFLAELEGDELEEALYLVQMDWLLASEAGLLFRIREELFALQDGYEKIFWHEHDGAPARKAVSLSVAFGLSEEDISDVSAA